MAIKKFNTKRFSSLCYLGEKMKNTFIMLIYIFIALGCQEKKTIKIHIEKNKPITIENRDSIVTKYTNFRLHESSVKGYIDYNESNNDIYRFGFHIKMVASDDEIKKHSYILNLLSYDLCSVGQIDFHKNYKLYKPFEALSLQDKEEEKSLYLTLEKLKQRKMIAYNSEDQENICIYVHRVDKTMSKIEYIESNSVVFTKEEINNALAEYKALQ